MANPFLNKTFLGAAARFLPGQNSPFSRARPYKREKVHELPHENIMGVPRKREVRPPRKKKDALTS